MRIFIHIFFLRLREGSSVSEKLSLEEQKALSDAAIVLSIRVTSVEITVSCNDNDEPGPGPGVDSVDVQTDFSEVEGTPDDESGSGSCNGDAVSFTIQITPDWDGSSYIADGVSKNDIEAKWNDGGNGSGEWLTSVTLNVQTLGPSNPIGNTLDSDEDVTVSWRAAVYSLEITAVAEDI